MKRITALNSTLTFLLLVALPTGAEEGLDQAIRPLPTSRSTRPVVRPPNQPVVSARESFSELYLASIEPEETLMAILNKAYPTRPMSKPEDVLLGDFSRGLYGLRIQRQSLFRIGEELLAHLKAHSDRPFASLPSNSSGDPHAPYIALNQKVTDYIKFVNLVLSSHLLEYNSYESLAIRMTKDHKSKEIMKLTPVRSRVETLRDRQFEILVTQQKEIAEALSRDSNTFPGHLRSLTPLLGVDATEPGPRTGGVGGKCAGLF